MKINLEYYKVFYFVAKYKSFTMAAKALYTGQPSVTRTIKKLEIELDTKLFKRNNQGVFLTYEGQLLYNKISKAMQLLDGAEAELSLPNDLKSGSISIGITEIALRCYALDKLKIFHNSYPNMILKINNYNTLKALEELKKSKIDLAIVTTPFEFSDEYEYLKLKTINDVAICSKNFSQIIDKKISLSELTKFPLISLSQVNSVTYDFYKNFFLRHNVSYSPTIETLTADLIPSLVEADFGIAFVPKELIKNYECKIINLCENIPPRYIYLVIKKGNFDTLAVQKLKEILLLD